MRHRLIKSLRIAVTAVSLLVCGLLIVLWVRSYFHPEVFSFDYVPYLRISAHSIKGSVGIMVERPWEGPAFVEIGPNTSILWSWEFLEPTLVDSLTPSSKWDFDSYNGYHKVWKDLWWYSIRTPHWLPITIFATIAALPWIKWRFSLRTLLIVLTLFALFFGAIAMSLWDRMN